jgi:hypothetical protein
VLHVDLSCGEPGKYLGASLLRVVQCKCPHTHQYADKVAEQLTRTDSLSSGTTGLEFDKRREMV